MTVTGSDLEALEVREGQYGDAVATIEPGGAEFIPLDERHGRPTKLFWTWMSPNFEFATVFVGVLSVAVFGLSFGKAVASLVLGTVVGSLFHGVLSARGPRYGVPQMVLSRVAFGYWGNVLPAGLQAVTAGIGWFAVNSVSGALALNTLTHLPKVLCLLIIAATQITIALFGHNLIHVFEKVAFPLLLVAFGLGAIWTFSKADYSGGSHEIPGAFLISFAAMFGYVAGWNPYAADYTRYLPTSTDSRAAGVWAAVGLGVSCIALSTLGAASATIATSGDLSPTAAFTAPYPTAVRDLVLLAIALGAVAANVINIYSGSMSFLTVGIRLHATLRRALAAAVFGVLGFAVAWSSLNDPTRYENFLLIIAYWLGPWLGVVLADQLLRRSDVTRLLYDHRHTSWAGPAAMVVGMAVSIPLFSNQAKYLAPIPKEHPGVGDLTFEVGFLVAAAVYAVLFAVTRRGRAR
ncbi:MAG TPA: cytosine permease [Mycobacteriales bacterium]|nr:cytosine permease [Mycobacteriales bacterium]